MSCITVHVIPHFRPLLQWPCTSCISVYLSPHILLEPQTTCRLCDTEWVAVNHGKTCNLSGFVNQKGATRKLWGLRKCNLEDNELMLIFLFLFCLLYWLSLEPYMLRIDSDLSDKKTKHLLCEGKKNISVRFIVIWWNKENYSIEKNDRIKKLGIKFKATWHTKSWGNGAVERWSAPKLARCWN